MIETVEFAKDDESTEERWKTPHLKINGITFTCSSGIKIAGNVGGQRIGGDRIVADLWDDATEFVRHEQFEELGRHFERIEFNRHSPELDMGSWEFGECIVDFNSKTHALRRVVYRVVLDIEFWQQNYSIAELASAISSIPARHPSYSRYWQEDENTCVNGFGLVIETDGMKTLDDVFAIEVHLAEIASDVRTRLQETEDPKDSVVLTFDFPAEIKIPCEQYLIYFVQFLKDLGIEAEGSLKHDVQRVLFTVTPSDGRSALDNVREALNLYLQMPSAEGGGIPPGFGSDIAISQLQANILHLQSQALLARAMLQAQLAAVSAKDEQIRLLQDRLDLRGFSEPARIQVHETTDFEPVIDGILAVKKFDYKFLEMNMPELLRRLKRRLK